VDKYNLSFPLRPERYKKLRDTLPGFPLIIINENEEIIFGIDYYHFLKSAGEAYTDALRLGISDKDALILNYNLKEKLTGVNLYEKLVFIKKWTTPAAHDGTDIELSYIYRKTSLDINVNRELMDKLDLLLSTVFRHCLINETVSLKTGLKLCDFQTDDRETLIEIFTAVSFSSSHQLKVLELVEEILFRDKCSMADIFKKLELRQYMDMEKPQKKIIDALFKYRNPVYVESETAWEEEMKRLNLPGNVKVTHYPYFEKRSLELTIQLKGREDLKDLIKKLGLPGIPHSGSE
jgi:hypothetical protein